MNDAILFNILYGLYFLTGLLYAITAKSQQRWVCLLSRLLLWSALACHTAVILQRWWQAQRPPLSNMFETLVFMGWAIVLLYLIMEVKYALRALGSVAAFGALLCLAYATLIFPNSIEPLMPALQNSFWLTTHVSICFLAYAAFTIGYFLCMMLLVRRRDWHRHAGHYMIAISLAALAIGLAAVLLQRNGMLSLSMNLASAAAISAAVVISAAVIMPAIYPLVRGLRLDSALLQSANLDQALHRTISFGFILLSLGIITGAVWAQQAWGRYWGWDPKETWSLVTWLVYGIYLHVRVARQNNTILTVWLAALGFWAVIFTYFGVNYLLSGLHSYA